MKSDREFLEGMWKQVEQMEDEFLIIEEARQHSRRILYREIAARVILFFLAIILLKCFRYMDSLYVYIAGFIAIGAAYLTEQSSFSTGEKRRYPMKHEKVKINI
ncbi:MAG: hypothetical protein E7255_03355 [Lachnospiraceae bacterium]|jgi:hypothetical protein|nr:hypothetical protein [Lachnospiraceae bacterium]